MQSRLDLDAVRDTAGGELLSPEMLLLMTLVLIDGYELFPARPPQAEIDPGI
jgi:hypothetical protein